MKPGFVLQQPDLARTLEALANEGPGLLYGGALGKKILDRLTELGGCMVMDDLLAAKATWRDPVAVTYRGRTVHVPPPPCEGFQFLLTLRILEGFDLAKMKRNSTEHVDTVLRAVRLAAGVRIATGVPAPQKLAEILSDAHVETLRARVRDGKPVIGPTEQWTPPQEPVSPTDESHTTSFSIADSDGNLICLTQSLGSVFGSGIVVPGTGLCLNNFLYWADVNPQSPNRVKPGDQLPMCMAPSISTKDGDPILALGTPGSYGILQTQPQAMVQHVDFGLPLQQAIEAPRGRLTDGAEVLSGIAPAAGRPCRPAQARPQHHDRPGMDHEGGRHAGRRGRSGNRHLHRRLRPAARRLLRPGLRRTARARISPFGMTPLDWRSAPIENGVIPNEVILPRPRRLGNLGHSGTDAGLGSGVGLGCDVAQGHDAGEVLVSVEDRQAPDLQHFHAFEHLFGLLVAEGIGDILGHAILYQGIDRRPAGRHRAHDDVAIRDRADQALSVTDRQRSDTHRLHGLGSLLEGRRRARPSRPPGS